MPVDQFIPVLDPGDAASNHTLQVHRLLADLGVAGEIFTEQTHPSLADRTRPFETHRGGPVLYQFAIGSRMADALINGRGPLAVNHHNVTPARFFEVWDPPLVHGTAWGDQQLGRLAARSDLAIAVSRFNAAELERAGFGHIEVAPILLDTAMFDRAVDPARVAALADGGPAWLFVGRLVPNKAQHRIIEAFAVARRRHPELRLWLVGGASSARYEAALRSLVDDLGLGGAVEFTGAAPPAELAARYRAAAVFVCTSEHEGFCVPLLEAMHQRLAIVAVDAAAVGETLGGGGLLLPESRPEVVACAVERVLDDAALRGHLVAAGTARLGEFALDRTRARFTAAITPWLERVL
jgi:glycosyltransferase involved in cell wall biosynthesis